MDKTKRQITKIARETNKLLVKMMKEEGIGSGEMELIHLVRHNPGITQKEIVKELNTDKAAIARRVASLKKKGYLVCKDNPDDGRSSFIYATSKAEKLKMSKVLIEDTFYEWLTEELDDNEMDYFVNILDKLYYRSKAESRKGFPEVINKLRTKVNEN
ncbi:MAG: MarR family winged helix-turn-helix transcriptional regulator [Erysipelotrichaceae bacterium]